MPRPVCTRCAREMKLTRAGVVVQLNARATAGPYQQWSADEYECPGCTQRIVTGYGAHPNWEHFKGVASRAVPDVVVEER